MGSKKSVSKVRRTKGKKAKLVVERVPLSATRHLAQPREGFEDFVESLAALAEKFKDDLGSGIDVELLRSSLQAYQSLESDRAPVVDELASIDSTSLVHSNAAWTQMLLIYGRSRQLARTNQSIGGAIEPFERFMKTGPRKSKTKAGTLSVPATGAAQP